MQFTSHFNTKKKKMFINNFLGILRKHDDYLYDKK